MILNQNYLEPALKMTTPSVGTKMKIGFDIASLVSSDNDRRRHSSSSPNSYTAHAVVSPQLKDGRHYAKVAADYSARTALKNDRYHPYYTHSVKRASTSSTGTNEDGDKSPCHRMSDQEEERKQVIENRQRRSASPSSSPPRKHVASDSEGSDAAFVSENSRQPVHPFLTAGSPFLNAMQSGVIPFPFQHMSEMHANAIRNSENKMSQSSPPYGNLEAATKAETERRMSHKERTPTASPEEQRKHISSPKYPPHIMFPQIPTTAGFSSQFTQVSQASTIPNNVSPTMLPTYTHGISPPATASMMERFQQQMFLQAAAAAAAGIPPTHMTQQLHPGMTTPSALSRIHHSPPIMDQARAFIPSPTAYNPWLMRHAASSRGIPPQFVGKESQILISKCVYRIKRSR